jgi:hypothetical protein
MYIVVLAVPPSPSVVLIVAMLLVGKLASVDPVASGALRDTPFVGVVAVLRLNFKDN